MNAVRGVPWAALALAGLLGAAADARAQQEGEVAAPPRDPAAQDTAGQDTLPPPPPAYTYVPPAFAITVTAGRPGSGPLQTQPVLVQERDLFGVPVDSVPLARSAEVQGGYWAAVSGVVSLGPAWAVRIGGGVAQATLVTAYDGEGPFATVAADRTGGQADLTAVSLESAVRYRIPSTRRIQPFVELGAAITRWTADGDLPSVAALESGVTRFEGLAGVGAVVPLNGRFSARFRASTRLFRTPLAPLAPGDTLAMAAKDTGPGLISRRSSFLLTTQAPAASQFADSARELLSLMRLEVGISLDLGRAAAEPQGPVATPDTTPPTDR